MCHKSSEDIAVELIKSGASINEKDYVNLFDFYWKPFKLFKSNISAEDLCCGLSVLESMMH